MTIVDTLTSAQHADAQQLVARGRRNEELFFNFEAGDNGAHNQLLAYQAGVLAGLATLFGDDPLEASLFVDPALRRQGIGRALLAAVIAEGTRRGQSDMVLVCNQESEAGRGFVAALGAPLRFVEHRLIFDPAQPRSRPAQQRLTISQVQAGDLQELVTILAQAFDDPVDFVTMHVERRFQQANQRFYIGRIGEQAIAGLRVSREDGGLYIAAFGVLPAYQGQGYGRELLSHTIDLLHAESDEQISIEVESDNDSAFGLYQSCGFRTTQTYGYYVVA